MSKIKVLPESVANKIAAGEVVERPASVVKELIENSLDAEARRIDIEIEAGGKRLIRVRDDGEGMTRDDALIAFERHATSKLRSAEDLEAISTLGFRGEALPSIASVSRLVLRTKTWQNLEGTEVEFNGGKLVAVRDIACPVGTEVEVRNLFFNVPARRKFLKSDLAEGYYVGNVIQHYALANPSRAFLFIKDGREVIQLARVNSIKDRAYQLLGAGLLEDMVEVSYEAEGISVTGFVSNPQEYRFSREAQYLFVNRRFVRDQLIGRALREAYRLTIPPSAHPVAVLFIELPPKEVDVNVHPAKTEVRFLHEGQVMAAVRSAVTCALKSARPIIRAPYKSLLATPLHPQSKYGPGFSNPTEPAPDSYKLEPPAKTSTPHEQKVIEFSFKRSPEQGAKQPNESYARSITADAAPPAAEQAVKQPNESYTLPSATTNVYYLTRDRQNSTDSGCGAVVEQAHPEALPGLGQTVRPLGQIRDSYIVATDEEGLWIIDQHVAHERVLFEQLRDRKLACPIETQPLLLPETLDLTPAESASLEAVQGEFESMGIEVMQLSGRTIAIKTAPAGLSSSDVVALVRETLAGIERERRNLTPDHIRGQIAAQLACKAAIKVNMPLTPEKMQWLIDELMKTQNPMTCPHGRPIIMRLELRDIERGFRRPV
jgi:DNA mismatch repair protein MutL